MFEEPETVAKWTDECYWVLNKWRSEIETKNQIGRKVMAAI